jgi:hypothetical protein
MSTSVHKHIKKALCPGGFYFFNRRDAKYAEEYKIFTAKTQRHQERQKAFPPKADQPQAETTDEEG